MKMKNTLKYILLFVMFAFVTVSWSEGDVTGEEYTDNIVKTLYLNEDPDNMGNFYTTFYDGQHAYLIPKGVKAYTATIEEDNVLLTPIDDSVIPKEEAVIIHSNSDEITLVLSDSDKERSVENRLLGVDDITYAPDRCYILSYGQCGFGFYRYAEGKILAAHKAFLIYSVPLDAPAPALRPVFVGGKEE